MANERIEELLIRIKSDKAAAAALRADIQAIKADLGSLSQVSRDFNAKLADMTRTTKIDQLGSNFGKLANKIGDADTAAKLLQERLQKIGATQPEIERAASAFFNASQAAAGDVGAGAAKGGLSGLKTLGRNIRNLPSVQIPGAGIGTDAIGNLLRVFGSLPPAVLPVVAVLGAAAAGFVILNKQLDENRKALEQARQSNADYYNAIAQNTTTNEAKKRIEDLQREIAAKQAEINNSTRATSDAFKSAQEKYGDALARVMFAVGGITPNTEDAQKELTKMQGELQGLTRATQDGSLAAADLAEKEKEIQAIRDKAADSYIARETQMAELLRSGTEDQVQKRIDALQDENKAIVEVINAGKLSKEELSKLSDKLGENNASLQELQTNVIDVVRARDKEVQSAKDQAAAMKTIEKVNGDIQAAAAKRSDDLAAMNQKYADSLDKLKTSYEQANIDAQVQQQQKLVDLAAQLSQQQADDAEKYREKESELQQKHNDDRVKVEEDYSKRLLEIEKRFTMDSQDAIQNRDAVALDAAERRRKSDLEDAKSQHDDQLRVQEKNYQQQLHDLQVSNQRQQQERIRDYNRRIQEANIAFARDSQQRALKYQRDQQQLAQAHAAEIAQRNQAYYKQLADLNNYLTTRMQTERGYFGTVLSYVIATKAKIDSLLGMSGGSTGSTQPAIKGRIVPSFDTEGVVLRSGIAKVDRGEVILHRQNVGAGNITFAPSISGMNRSQVRREMIRQMDQFLKAAGL